MKIICKKENDIRKMIELIKHLLETDCMDYPILQEDLVLEFSLKDSNGKIYPKNNQTISFDEEDLQNTSINFNALEYYYNNDALTGLYNRGRYERDILQLQEDNTDAFICIYIDAVGLHEINNHLGHAAGDSMLCGIAKGIRQYFPKSTAYRIGGDEFVIFCLQKEEGSVKDATSQLRNLLSQENYEISIGIKTKEPDTTILQTINQAEHAMRDDKTEFYRKNGAKRQMRMLNYKLEKILLEKQDANQFLDVIASEYKGVYMVNPENDTCRYIYIPEYFKNILENNDGIFSKSIRTYCSTFVCENDQQLFEEVFDYDYITKQIKAGNSIAFTYTKKDGSKVHLQITIYNPNAPDSNEMLWIFTDLK